MKIRAETVATLCRTIILLNSTKRPRRNDLADATRSDPAHRHPIYNFLAADTHGFIYALLLVHHDYVQD